MKRTLLSLAAAAAIVSAATLLPTHANAMGVGTAAAIDVAISDMSLMEDVRYVCRRSYSGRRVCWWAPGRGYHRPYRGYHRPYRGYHRPYRGHRRWHY